jgi:uncharacterized membrane protein
MKQILKSLCMKIVDGFLLLLPFLLTYLLLGQLFDGMMALTAPIVDLLPKGGFSSPWALRFTAAGLLAGCCFLVGIGMKTRVAKYVGNWIEVTFLNRFPPYVILRNLTRRIAGHDMPNQLQPALIHTTPGTHLLGFIVEEHQGGKFTVFVPLAPTPGVGTLQIVNHEKIQKIEAPMKDALGAILNWGVGTEDLLKTKNDLSQ